MIYIYTIMIIVIDVAIATKRHTISFWLCIYINMISNELPFSFSSYSEQSPVYYVCILSFGITPSETLDDFN